MSSTWTSMKTAMRVLLATDGSDHANAATDWLRYLPFPSDREVMVVTVVEPPSRRWSGAPEPNGAQLSTRIVHARRLADGTASRLLAGRRSVGRVVEGTPQDEIVAAARDWDADVVVVGERGLSPFRGFLLGSVSMDVLRNAPCPVIVCKGLPREVRTVTVAFDGSEHARRALIWVGRLPLAPTVRLHLVGVVGPQDEPSTTPYAGHASLEAELGVAARMLLSRGADVETRVASGVPGPRIVEETERLGSDLLVVGARGVGFAMRLLLGSVSEWVLHHARCPVLVVRPTHGREFSTTDT